MNNFLSLLLPVAIGLIAGLSHGVVSHYTDLPTSLQEPTAQPFANGQSLKD